MAESASGSGYGATGGGEDAAHPQKAYAELRKQGEAVRADGSVATATKAATDIVLRTPEVYSSVAAVQLGNVRPLIPLQVDPPQHVKYRKILDPIFAPKQMAPWEAPVTKLVNDHIDRFIERGECNFTNELAVPLPSQVFLTLLGAPLDDLPELLRFKDGIIRPDLDPDADLSDPLSAMVAGEKHRNATGQEIYDYFTALIGERRKSPKDDIISRFLSTEIDGERLTDEEILDIGFLFLIAGLDTVTDSLTCMYAFLSQNAEHRRQIAADPSIIPAAVEELLRWESPVPGVIRLAATDADLLGCPVKEGDFVFVNIGSANTDPAFLDDADVVRFDRESNPHLAFGGGVHRCLGSHLARQELRVTMREWHRRIPEYELTPGTELHYQMGLRSVENLMLSW